MEGRRRRSSLLACAALGGLLAVAGCVGSEPERLVLAPDGRTAVVFARRPGRFALVLDLERGRAIERFSTPPGRHFCGHGFYAPGGRLVYATENDYEAERGVLGVYDTSAGGAGSASWTRTGSAPTRRC